MKLVALSVLILILFYEIDSTISIYRFKSISCNSSGKTFKFLFCYVKTYEKKTFTVNVALNKTRVLNDDYLVNFAFEKLTSGKFEKKIGLDKVQWCRILENARVSPFLFQIIESLSTTAFKTYFLNFCHLIGVVKSENISLTNTPILT